MRRPLLVIVSGLPCSGKTSLAERIAEAFSLPLVTKDGIKEQLFDALGWSDRAWSRKLSLASYRLMFLFLETLLAAGRDCIAEGNFDPAVHGGRFAALRESRSCEIFQIHCVTEGDVLLARFRERWERGERHPGHLDDVTFPELRSLVAQGRRPPLALEGEIRELDTTDVEQLDLGPLLAAIGAALAQEGT